ncbi:hypothetical protein Mgrana_03015 [Meiothermus granaticius NBRC 107808]|uniref:Uncharacterized protein n=1 Tax=Meiothermus granaticius NBRC 107808 TaxID=1227551 RepID=A0A399F4I8_9DEIN|nr:hypothetical protein Mgrana_03015 [Meiothermus granaticius NBRC 107808]
MVLYGLTVPGGGVGGPPQMRAEAADARLLEGGAQQAAPLARGLWQLGGFQSGKHRLGIAFDLEVAVDEGFAQGQVERRGQPLG